MNEIVSIRVHRSQFPGAVRESLLASLRSRRVNHKFHYETIDQVNHWLDLHEKYSPARVDPGCVATYATAFGAALGEIGPGKLQLVGLGCGGGQKDRQLIEQGRARGIGIAYQPCDVSVGMVLQAAALAGEILPPGSIAPAVFDLQEADLREILPRAEDRRLVTFFGMMPNFEPGEVLPRLAAALHPGDLLLLSANLAPGTDYAAGTAAVVPLYDNPETRAWLMLFLRDLGVNERDGRMVFSVEAEREGLRRIRADFLFERECSVRVGSETVLFRPGEDVRLFFSYRYTPALLAKTVARHGMDLVRQWITPAGDEGVFLCRKAA